MKTSTLALLASLTISTATPAQEISLEMKGGGLGDNLEVHVAGQPGSGYLLLMSLKYETTALPSPHVSPIDVGLDLVSTSVSTPGFVGITPANLIYLIPNVPAWHGGVMNFQALKISGPVLTQKSEPVRVTLSEKGETLHTLEESNFSRAFGTSTTIDDKTVLLAGGSPVVLPYSSAAAIFSDTTGSSTAELYHPSTESFEPIGNMVHLRSRHVATRLQDGRVLITGGSNGTLGLASAEIYDPATRTFSAVGSMAQGRVGHTATLLLDGRVLVAGGSTAASNQAVIAANALNTTELFDPATSTFSPGPSIVYNRSFHTATRVDDGRVIFAGGFSSSGGNNFVLSSVMIYTPNGGLGSLLNMPNLAAPRMGHGAALLDDGRVLVVGGMDGIYTDAVAVKSAEVIDPLNNSTADAAFVATETAFPQVVKLENGDVLVTGGARGVGSFEQPLHIGSLWRQNHKKWFVTGDCQVARYGSSSTLLADGTIAIFHGKFFGSLLLKSAEIYQPN